MLYIQEIVTCKFLEKWYANDDDDDDDFGICYRRTNIEKGKT